MLIDLSPIRKDTGASLSVREQLDLSELDEGFFDVTFEGTVRNIAGVLTLKAEMNGIYRAECARCLKPAEMPLHATIDTIFDGDCSKDDSVTFENGRIDLTKTVFDALSLEIPIRILCRPDCRGLCPVCGADLNSGECGCCSGITE